MKLSRRNFVRSSALVGAACLGPGAAFAELSQAVAGEAPIRLGIASYTFRNFSRAQMIGFLKTLRSERLAWGLEPHLRSFRRQSLGRLRSVWELPAIPFATSAARR